MARLPPGALMQRAAHGLAVACARPARPGLRRARRAARRRRQQRRRRAAGPARGWPRAGRAVDGGAGRRARGRRARRAAARPAGGSATPPRGDADLVVDGLVGIGGRGRAAPGGGGAGRAGRAAATSSRSTCRAGSTPTPARWPGAAVRADADRHLRHPQAGAARRRGPRARRRACELVDIGLGRPAGAAGRGRSRTPTSPRCCRAPSAGRDKYTRGVVGVAAGSPAVHRRGGARGRRRGARRRRHGPLRRRAARRPSRCGRAGPRRSSREAGGGRRSSTPAGCRPGSSDRASAPTTGPPRPSRRCSAQDVPVLVDADALTVCARHPEWLRRRTAPTLLTPHDREFARFGREVGADRLGARPARWPPSSASPCCSRATPPSSPTRTARARVNATGTPGARHRRHRRRAGRAAAARCSRRGSTPLDAGCGRRAPARPSPARCAAAGATTSASAVLEAWPDAVRAVRAARLGMRDEDRGAHRPRRDPRQRRRARRARRRRRRRSWRSSRPTATATASCRAPAPPSQGGAAWLGVAFLEEALALRAAGLDVPLLAWLIAPGEDLAPGRRRRRRPRRLRRRRSCAARRGRRARRRSPGAGPAQGRHRPVPRRGHRRPTGPTCARRRPRPRPTARSGSSGCGATSPSPTAAPTTRSTAGRPASSPRRSRSPTAPGCGPRCATWPTPPPRSPRRPPTTTSSARASRSTGCRPVPQLGRPGGLRPAPGDDAGLHGRAHQAGAGRQRRQLPAPLRHASARRPSRWCRSATPTACRARDQRRPGAAAAAPAAPSPARSAWTSSCSTSATTRSRPATRCCCSAPATRASRPRRTGPRRSAPSTTRSSPASAPGCRGRAGPAVSPRPASRARRRGCSASSRSARRVGLAAERYAVGRTRLRPDPEAREPFFALPADRTRTVARRGRRAAARRGGRPGGRPG